MTDSSSLAPTGILDLVDHLHASAGFVNGTGLVRRQLGQAEVGRDDYELVYIVGALLVTANVTGPEAAVVTSLPTAHS